MQIKSRSKKEKKGKSMRFYLKRKKFLILLGNLMILIGAGSVWAEIKPQFGFDYFAGTNQLQIFSPWAGLRLSLSYRASFILRYHYQNFSYNYKIYDGGGNLVSKTFKAKVNRLTGTLYLGGEKLSGYVNYSHLFGTHQYRGYLVDTGLEGRFIKPVSALVSLYGIREKTVLWHPQEEARWRKTYSLKMGVKIWMIKGVALNPNIYLIKNSEGQRATAFSVGLVYSPNWWLAITCYYFRYNETAFYAFYGNYLSLGLNFFF